jgi:hypothetical protein
MVDYAAVPLSVPPGIYSETTDVGAQGRWVDGSNVRFWKGMPRRIGSWTTLLDSANTDNPIRGIKAWTTSAGAPWLAFGSADGLYLYNGSEYDITPSGLTAGPVDAVNPTGYGTGLYGLGFYSGTSFLAVTSTPPRMWSLANYGEDLLAVPSDDGTLYLWDASVGTGTPAAAVANAPTGNLGVLVTDDRHVMVFGAGGDLLKVQWCDQEDITNWTIDSTTTAGSYTLEDGTRITGWCKTGQGILVLTDYAAYILRYIGGEFTFSKTRVGVNCGCIGQQAVVGLDSIAYWMGANGFHVYNGRVSMIPCDVHTDVFDDFNSYQMAKTYCGTNAKYDEITWWYPSAASTEINRYVTFSPTQGWSKGTLARSSWLDSSGISPGNPIAAGIDGKIYQHEVEGAEESLAWSFDLAYQDAAAGAQEIIVRKFLPDFRQQDGHVTLTLGVANDPQSTQRTKGPYTIAAGQNRVSVRARGSYLQFKLSGTDEFWMGTPRLYMRTVGANVG